MPDIAVCVVAVVAFAVVLRLWLYVDLEDGLAIGTVFCLLLLLAHAYLTA